MVASEPPSLRASELPSRPATGGAGRLRPVRSDGTRADAVDNRRRLVAAVGRTLASGESVALTRLASEAGVSRATAYRNFADPDAAVDAYVEDFLDHFELAVAAEGGEEVGLEELCRIWNRLVGERSAALVHVRSVEGFLARVRRGEPHISRIHRIVAGAIVGDRRYRTITGPDLDYAVFLWNLLLDPRELLDLAGHLDRSVVEVGDRLTGELLGCLDRLAAERGGAG